MCNMAGIFVKEGTPMTKELVRLLLRVQILNSKIHSDGFGYFLSDGSMEYLYGKTHLAAKVSWFPRDCLDGILPDTRFLLTHIRKASSGKVALKKDASEEEIKEHAEKLTTMSHPFLNQCSVLQHNGTLEAKNDIEVDMDSKFLAEKFDNALIEGQNVKKALKHAFSFFKHGSASLMFAIKYTTGWKPYFYKGNKPLNRYIDKERGITIVTTASTDVEKELDALCLLNDYYFEEEKIPHDGIYEWNRKDPISKGSLINSAPVATTTYYPNNRRNAGRYGTVVDNSKVNASKDAFNNYVEKLGREGLMAVTSTLINSFTREDLMDIVDFDQDSLINLLQDLEKGLVEKVRSGINKVRSTP